MKLRRQFLKTTVGGDYWNGIAAVLNKNRICLIGGTGFLGRHICEQLQRCGLSAVTLSRNPDSDFLKKCALLIEHSPIGSPEGDAVLSRCDALVYLASSSLPSLNWDNPAAELEYNSLNDVRFLSKFADINPEAHIIYASSGGQIYGSGHSAPIKEETPSMPKTAYAFGKQVIETTLSFLSSVKGNPVTILRIANPVGRWQVGRKHGFVSAAINAGLTGGSLNLYGEGNNIRDYFDADDLSELIVSLTQMPQNSCKIYNIGSGIGRTEIEVINLVTDIIGSNINIIRFPSRPYDLDYSLLNCSKAASEIGWSPNTTMVTSIGKIIQASRAR